MGIVGAGSIVRARHLPALKKHPEVEIVAVSNSTYESSEKFCRENVPRVFGPNLHEHRIWVPELKKFVRIRVTARGLKTINKNGAYRALKKAGVI